MLESIRETMKGELFDYLNSLIRKELYPYLFQVSGKYSAKKLHMKIEDEFDFLLAEMEIGKKGDIDRTALRICELMDGDISEFILTSSKSNIYFLDLRIFAKDVSAKIRKIIDSYKILYEKLPIKPIEIKKLAQ